MFTNGREEIGTLVGSASTTLFSPWCGSYEVLIGKIPLPPYPDRRQHLGQARIRSERLKKKFLRERGEKFFFYPINAAKKDRKISDGSAIQTDLICKGTKADETRANFRIKDSTFNLNFSRSPFNRIRTEFLL